jgi:hypothetical protein
MKVSFVQLSEFVSDCRRLGLDDDAVRELELLIMERPEAGKPMRGTGGVRKIRFSPSASRRGKSGSIRALYAYFVHADLVYLLAAFGKNEKENISNAEKNEYRVLMHRLKQLLNEE